MVVEEFEALEVTLTLLDTLLDAALVVETLVEEADEAAVEEAFTVEDPAEVCGADEVEPDEPGEADELGVDEAVVVAVADVGFALAQEQTASADDWTKTAVAAPQALITQSSAAL